MLAATALAEEKANSELQAEQRRQKLFDVLAKGAVQKAEIEQEISNKNLDTEIANELRKDVEKIKTEVIKKIDQGNDEGGTNEPTLQSLSSFARSMLLEVSADLAKPYIQLNEFLSGGSLQFGASSISQNDVGSQTWQSYIAAIRELERKGLIYRRDAVAPHWQISAKGYEVADKV
ncbi:MAG: hypothetical protein ABJQ23_15220 [Shimia thalassica]|uniref:hypothetical protein n=1 Tax=Shimia thalassica TaxID=1715693 RepID=UPI003296FD19